MSSLRPMLAIAAMENAMIEGKATGLCGIAIFQGGCAKAVERSDQSACHIGDLFFPLLEVLYNVCT